MNSFWVNLKKAAEVCKSNNSHRMKLKISESAVQLFDASRNSIITFWQQISAEIKYFLLCKLDVHCAFADARLLFQYTHHTLGSNECSQGASPWGAGGTERQTDLLSSHQCSVHLYQHSLSLLCAFILHHTEASHRAAFILSKLQKGTWHRDDNFRSWQTSSR